MEYPARDIKALAIFGAVVTAALIILPILGIGYVTSEAARFVECQGRSPKDSGCEAGPLWGFFGSLETEFESQMDTQEIETPIETP